MGVKLIAAVWGFAEATFFFIVPDVWTSSIGLKNLKAGMVSCLWALYGAMAGGLIMYLWGSFDPLSAATAIEWVPAISDAMVNRAAEEMANDGVLAVLLGPLSGTPYKIYAAQAKQAGVSGGVFLLITIPARLIRFVVVTAVIHAIGRVLLVRIPYTKTMIVFVLVWVLFYMTYLWVMPW